MTDQMKCKEFLTNNPGFVVELENSAHDGYVQIIKEIKRIAGVQ